MVTRTPQEAVSDPKIATHLDDLLQDCLDAVGTAQKLNRGKVIKALDNQTVASFNKCIDKVLAAAMASENERDRCLNGQARDTKKMKAILQVQLDALDNLEEYIGRLQVLEDQALATMIDSYLAVIALVGGANGELLMLQRRLTELSKKLAKAIRATRDAKLKGMIGAAIGAIGVCLVPFGLGVAVIGGLTLAGGELILRQALNGNEETTVKKSWSHASTAGAVADGLGRMPKSFATVSVLVTGAVDLREGFKTEREKVAVQNEIRALMKDMKHILPKATKQFKELQKTTNETQRALKRAIQGVRAFKPGKGPAHALVRMI